ncbi:MAG: four helix bundle protein [Kiritimatiellae bacterium]|nr:four helix bundle protein [Kiritimatiellia bacterium]
MRNYKNIKAWQYADDLTVEIYRQTQGFPREEVYGLANQLRRASYSVPSNIAEGSARSSKKEYLHFLYISRGSLSETEYFIHLSLRLGYISNQTYNTLTNQVNSTFARLHGLIKAVEKETGRLKKGVALLTSTLVIGLGKTALNT